MQSKHDSPGTVQGSDTEEPFRAGTRGPRWLAIVAVVLVAGWLTYFAKDTVNYVLPVVRNAVQSIVNIYKGSQAPRTLFQSPTGYVAPTWQRITGFASVVFLAAGVPFGLRAFWREYRKNGVALILVGMGLVYFAVLLLRFAPAAWETGNRTSEFLFIGLAFLLSIGSAELWHPRQAAWFSKAVFAAVICIIFIGGIVSGWPPLQVLQRPFEVQVGDRIFEPQGVSAARWFLSQLGPGNRLGADESNARLMLTYGNQVAFESRFPNIKDIISTPDFPSWQPQILRGFSIRYLVMDERQVSRDNIAGYFFNQPGSPQDLNSDFIDPQVYNKFENMPAVNRILDSGNLSIYDFISLLHPRP